MLLKKYKIHRKRTTYIIFIIMIISVILGCEIYRNYEMKRMMKIKAKDFKIIVVTDLHYLSKDLYDNGSKFNEIINNADGKETGFTSEILDSFIYNTLKEKPDAVVLTGDLTFNGEKLSHKELAKRLRELTDAGIKVLAFAGNHDTNNSYAVKYLGDDYEKVDTVNSKEFGDIYNDFGISEAINVDEASNSFVYELEDKVWLICLDTNTDNNENRVLEETYNWLEELLKEAKQQGIKIISFTHQNLLLHNEAFKQGFKIKNSERLVNLYKKYNVKFNFSGHMHIQHIKKDNFITEIATSSLSVWPYQYGVISYTDGKISYNTRKLDFNEQSSNFFDELTYKKTYSSLSDYDISEKEKQEMIEYFVRLNREYFSGKLDLEMNMDSARVRKLWKENAKDSFLYYYIKSIENEEYVDQNIFQQEW